jgi:hypothetical protein
MADDVKDAVRVLRFAFPMSLREGDAVGHAQNLALAVDVVVRALEEAEEGRETLARKGTKLMATSDALIASLTKKRDDALAVWRGFASCDACGGRFHPLAKRCPTCGDAHKLSGGDWGTELVRVTKERDEARAELAAYHREDEKDSKLRAADVVIFEARIERLTKVLRNVLWVARGATDSPLEDAFGHALSNIEMRVEEALGIGPEDEVDHD